MVSDKIIYPRQEISRDYPVNIIDADKQYFQQSKSGISKETTIKKFVGATVNNELFIKSGMKVRIYMESFGDAWQDGKYNTPKYQLRSFIKNLFRSGKKFDSVLWCFDQFSTGGYFHWITEISPRLWVASQCVDKEIPLLIPEYFLKKWRFASSFLNAFGREIITFKSIEVALVKQMIFISQTGGPFNYQPSPIQASVKFLSDFYYDRTHGIPSNKRIYISRKKAGKRMILNDTEVESLVLSYGYTIVFPDDLEIRDQINLFCRSTHLISIHGAGLSNMVFMPIGSTIVEIRHKESNHMLNCFYTLAHTFKHKYYYCFGYNWGDSLQTELRPEDKSIHADISMLRGILERLHK